MTPIQAYELTLEKIEELKNEGIEVEITPCASQNNKKLVEDYSSKENIPPDKWINVTFTSLTQKQTERLTELANYLGLCGIRFDTGGWQGERDWELDWSFKYTGKEDQEWRDARYAVEHLINKSKKK